MSAPIVLPAPPGLRWIEARIDPITGEWLTEIIPLAFQEVWPSEGSELPSLEIYNVHGEFLCSYDHALIDEQGRIHTPGRDSPPGVEAWLEHVKDAHQQALRVREGIAARRRARMEQHPTEIV